VAQLAVTHPLDNKDDWHSCCGRHAAKTRRGAACSAIHAIQDALLRALGEDTHVVVSSRCCVDLRTLFWWLSAAFREDTSAAATSLRSFAAAAAARSAPSLSTACSCCSSLALTSTWGTGHAKVSAACVLAASALDSTKPKVDSSTIPRMSQHQRTNNKIAIISHAFAFVASCKWVLQG
jgi:hypothetical protein